MLNLVALEFHTNAARETFTLFITINLSKDCSGHYKLLNCRKSSQLGKNYDYKTISEMEFQCPSGGIF